MKPKRLRVFAGPNGSGKSTLMRFITENFPIPFGYFVNADLIEAEIKQSGSFDFTPSGLHPLLEDFLTFASLSTYNQDTGASHWLKGATIEKNSLLLPNLSKSNITINSYHAALIADFLRTELVKHDISFSFETVMSDRRKLDFLSFAYKAGYRVYLYYVATESYEINLARVRNRTLQGGHSVPDEKVISRYERSLDILSQAIHDDSVKVHRVYLFDNSAELNLQAEIADGSVEIKTNNLTSWIGKVLRL